MHVIENSANPDRNVNYSAIKFLTIVGELDVVEYFPGLYSAMMLISILFITTIPTSLYNIYAYNSSWSI